MKHVATGIPVLLGMSAAALAELAAGWLRVLIMAGGGVLTLGVGWYLMRTRRYEAARARMEMCRVCQALSESPVRCGVPMEDRPPNCPQGGLLRH